MKEFMMITFYEGQTGASFYDHFNDAHNAYMDAECGLGAHAEIYQRMHDEEGDRYELIFS